MNDSKEVRFNYFRKVKGQGVFGSGLFQGWHLIMVAHIQNKPQIDQIKYHFFKVGRENKSLPGNAESVTILSNNQHKMTKTGNILAFFGLFFCLEIAKIANIQNKKKYLLTLFYVLVTWSKFKPN